MVIYIYIRLSGFLSLYLYQIFCFVKIVIHALYCYFFLCHNAFIVYVLHLFFVHISAIQLRPFSIFSFFCYVLSLNLFSQSSTRTNTQAAIYKFLYNCSLVQFIQLKCIFLSVYIYHNCTIHNLDYLGLIFSKQKSRSIQIQKSIYWALK